MELLRVEIIPLFLLVGLIGLSRGAPKGNRHHKHVTKGEEPAKSRSYIDIDASDPFKVPKSSHYINRPIPEFSQAKEEKVEEGEPEHTEHHGEREHDNYSPAKDSENSDEDMKDTEMSHETREHSDHEHEDDKESNEKSHDSSDEHDSNMEDSSQPQEESSNSSLLPKEIDLPADAKTLGNLEQDTQSIQKSIQSVEPVTEQVSDEGYKKSLTSTEDEGVASDH